MLKYPMMILKKFLGTIFLISSLIFNLLSQSTYDIQFVLNNIDCNSNIVCYDVQLRSNNGTPWGLAGQNYRLYYDASLSTYQSGLSSLGIDYQNFTLVQHVQNEDAGGMGSLPFESNLSFLNYSIDLNSTSLGGVNLPSDGSWLTTSQLCFSVQAALLDNPNNCFEAVWARGGLTDAYATSFVEVSEWVTTDSTRMATGMDYNDLDSSDGESSCLANSCAATGSYDIQMTLNNVDCEANTVCYNVQLRSNDGNDWGLAGQNYRLYYDGAMGSYQSGSSLLGTTDYNSFMLHEDVQNQNATGTGNLNFEGDLSFLNYSIDLSNTSGGGVSLPSDGSWFTTSQLCFSVQAALLDNPNNCFEAVWSRMGSTDAYATSFVEVSEWVTTDSTRMATGMDYNDLDSSDGESSCLANSCAATGSYDIQMTLNNVDCEANTVCYNVQLRSNDGNDWGLAGQNYRLYYDGAMGSYQSGSSLLGTTDYNSFMLHEDVQNQNATGTGNLNFEGDLSFLNYSIDLSNTSGGGVSLPSDGSWFTTSQLCFSVQAALLDNPNNCFEAVWSRMGSTDAYATSFVEVAEWVTTDSTRMATGMDYNDLDSSDGESSCLANSCAATGSYDIQMTLNNVDCEANTVCYNVQLRSNDGNDWGLAGQNYRLYYDGAMGSYQSGSSLLGTTDYNSFMLHEDVQNQNATGTGNLNFEGDLSFLNYSIDLSNTSGGGVSLPSDGSWFTTSQLCFSVQAALLDNPNNCFEAVWSRMGSTDAYATSFVEVAEWVTTDSTRMATGMDYNDLDSSDGESSCLANSCAATGSYDIQMTLNNVDCEANTVCYNVQLRSNDGNDWGLAGQNYRLYYDGAMGSYQSGSSLLGTTDYNSFMLQEDVQNQNATGTGNLNFEGDLSFLNYSIDLSNTSGGGVSLPSDGSWFTTSQLCFSVQAALLDNPNNCFEAVWSRMGSTDAYATSFVEVAEWVTIDSTRMATGMDYNDLDSSDGESSCLANSCAATGSYDIQMTLNNVDCEANTVCYNVQLRSNDGNDWGLAGQNYRLYYDGAMGSYQSGSSLLGTTDYNSFMLQEDVQNQNATGTGNLNFEGDLSFLNYSIDLSNTSGGGVSLPSDGSWFTTSQLCFSVQAALLDNPNNCFEAVWSRMGSTDAYATSFVEVAEWVTTDSTRMATGMDYNDLDSSDGESSCLANSCAATGSYDIQMTLNNVDCEANTVCYNVQLRSNDGNDWGLAGQNYRLYYDGAMGSYQSGSSLLGTTDYNSFMLQEDVQNQNATGTGNLNFEGDLSFLNYSIDLSNTSGGGVSLPSDGSWFTTSQLCFSVQAALLDNPNNCFEAVWSRMGSTDAYATSFVEVAEWVTTDSTRMATGMDYNDLDSSDGESSCLANSCAATGSYDIQMTLNNVDCEANTVCYNVQLRSNDGNDWGLAGQNYRLYYDGAMGSYQSGSSLLGTTDYNSFMLQEDVQNQNATGTGNLNFEGDLSFLNYSIDLSNTSGGGVSLPSDGSWFTTSQLCFSVQAALLDNPNNCFEAVWSRMGSTDAYATSFVEVAEWVTIDSTRMATGMDYNDLDSSDGESSCLVNSCAPVGQYAIQLSLKNLDCQTNTACYDVQLQSTDGNDWGLAGQNYRLYYDATLGNYQSGISLLGNTDYGNYSLIQDVQNEDASGTGNLAFESTLSFLNYTIDLENTTGGGVNLPADGSWVTTSQLCFQLTDAVIDDPAICFEAIWARMDTSAAYATSFVEVAEWIGTENTRMADGIIYNDLGDYNACFAEYAPVYDTIRTTICEGDFYTFDGQNLMVAGNYNDTLAGAIACDSILTLVLTVNPTPVLITRDTLICADASLDLSLLAVSSTPLQYYNTLVEAESENNAITSTIAINGDAKYYIRTNVGTNPTCHTIDSIQITTESCGDFDLALQKIVAPNQPALFSPGDTVRFIIKVINQGTKDAYNYTVVDYSAGTGLNFINDGAINPNWALFSTNPSTYGLPEPLVPNDTTFIPIAFIVDAGVDSMMLTNLAEISSADDDQDTSNPRPTDIDSGFDALPDNDVVGGDNILNNDNFDEDDHDFAKVFICTTTLMTRDTNLCGGAPLDLNTLVTTNDLSTYHTSLNDAQLGINGIANSINFDGTATKYYVRAISTIPSNCFKVDSISIQERNLWCFLI